jgi:hypothetical protein
MKRFIFGMAASMAFTISTLAAPLSFQSAVAQTQLVEIYTSEGCSSCPPADGWMNGLKDSPGLWKDFVPLAFHVDYWDYLGWRDPWAARAYSDRQRAYSAEWQTESVGTPGLVLNGREARGWPQGAEGLKVLAAKAGVLSATSADTNHWQISFAPAAGAGKFEVHAALLGSELSSYVKAGENRGRTLKHDFTVLELTTAPLTKSGDAWTGDLALPVTGRGGNLAVAVWVTAAGRMQPVQATGGWISPR